MQDKNLFPKYFDETSFKRAAAAFRHIERQPHISAAEFKRARAAFEGFPDLPPISARLLARLEKAFVPQIEET
jgi:hypothetical protein